LGLCQKIKEGRYSPIPTQYSPELRRVIDMCLRTNPSERPDTAKLLDLDVMRMIRREMEAADISKALRSREEILRRKEQDIENREKSLEKKMEEVALQLKAEIDADLRGKWQAKAEIEIQRRVKEETQRLFELYENDMAAKVKEAYQHMERDIRSKILEEEQERLSRRLSSLGVVQTLDLPSILRTSAGSSTSTNLSHSTAPSSPPSLSSKSSKLLSMTDYFPPPSPMDISISTPFNGLRGNHSQPQLETSPLYRRTSNLFNQVRSSSVTHSDDEDDDEDDVVAPAAPTSKPVRPFPLISRKTAPVMPSQGMLQKTSNGLTTPTRGRQQPIIKNGAPALAEKRQSSPTRKINFAAGVGGGAASKGGVAVGVRTAIYNNRAKSLRELAEENQKKARVERGKENEEKKTTNNNNSGSDDEMPVWDPEVDEMPSPFLVRSKRIYC